MTHNNMLSCKQHEYEGKKQGMSRKRDQRELPSKLNVKLSDEIRFQNAGKRQIMIISDFYVVNTSPLYKIIAVDSLVHIIKLYPVWFADVTKH